VVHVPRFQNFSVEVPSVLKRANRRQRRRDRRPDTADQVRTLPPIGIYGRREAASAGSAKPGLDGTKGRARNIVSVPPVGKYRRETNVDLEKRL